MFNAVAAINRPVVPTLALVLGLTVWLQPADARACGSCVDDFASSAPGFRREPLPQNAKVLVAGTGLAPGSIAVTGDVGGAPVEVPFTVEEAGDAVGSVFVAFRWPAAEPGRVTIESNLGGNTYAIGTRLDETPPEAPTVAIDENGRRDGCCTVVSADISATGGADDDGTNAAVMKVVLSSPAGERVALFSHRPGTSEPVGSSTEGCLGNDPLAVDGDEVDATITLLDWAGNESAPVGPLRFTYRTGVPAGCPDTEPPTPSNLPEGCAQVGAAPVGLALAALVSLRLLAARRRRA